MSAKETEPPHEDNYERAYEQPVAQESLPATPVHGYWRSLAELDGKAKFQTDPAGAANEFPPIPVSDPMSRRNFFHLMGASMALAGVATGCRYEKEEIVPLARRPEDQIPGTTQQFATAVEIGGVGHALVASSYEGRPIKLDGNDLHPFASGTIVPPAPNQVSGHAGCSTYAQASILHLYDPDRSTGPQTGGAGTTMDAARAAIDKIRQNIAGAHILCEGTSSPTVRMLQRALADKKVVWHEYEPLSWDNEREGMKKAFDRAVRPIAHLDQAETIVTLDCDLFVEHPAAMRYSRDFARSRRPGGTLGPDKMNRLWSIESTLSNTGAMADHRLALRSDFGLTIAQALDAMLGGSGTPGSAVLQEPKVKRFLEVLLEELRPPPGSPPRKSVVICGRRQPPDVHALVARINEKLGAPGVTLEYVEDKDAADRPETHRQSISSLQRELNTGGVKTLIIIGGNPVYDAPADLDFEKALARAETSIHLSEYVNETSAKCKWHVPKAHFLEAWGDTRTWDGTLTIAQPLIAPLFGGISTIEMLSLLLGNEKRGDDLIKAAHAQLNIGTDDRSWKQHVHDGFVVNTAAATAAPTTRGFDPPRLSATQAGGNAAITTNVPVEVTFLQSPYSYDGRFANNAWLQETPDFMTKVCWDNYALVGPDTAAGLGIENDTMITVKIGGFEVEVACHTLPGQARGSIGLVLGGGRTHAGRVGGSAADERRVGWNTYKVRGTAGWDIVQGAQVSSTGKKYILASVQEHWDIRSLQHPGIKPSVNAEGLQERLPELVRDVNNDDFSQDKNWKAEPDAEVYWDDAHVRPEGARRGLSLFKEHDYPGRKWAMAIDLTTCTGCNSCMVACQAENNVPVVGRKEIHNNREMHWIRIDRYFKGPPEDPTVVYQPVACQQCENAPCEQVCPVGATTHTDEGLNDQAYNRCIGTRYCANNCPYKVRKFNFLDWNKEWREARNKVRRLLFNPEVTVRMRGVMEKCTFCVQRIQNAKISARAAARNERPGDVNAPMPDGTIVTACQQACPTEAIIFGDLSDPSSRVSRLHEDRRHYDLLPETYTKPRNKFLAKVRNPHPKLAPPAKPKHEGGEHAPAKGGAPESHGGGHP